MTDLHPPRRTTAHRRADRQVEAVHARRAELRAARTELTGGHRAELRTGLALARLAATAAVATDLRGLTGQAREYLSRSNRAERARFPSALLDVLAELRRTTLRRAAAIVGSAAARTAARRGIRLAAAEPPGSGAFEPPPPEPAASWWAGVASSWRTALLPAAVLPMLGLVAGPGKAPVVLALGTAAALAAGARCAVAADRARLRRWCDEVLVAARVDAEACLTRLLLHVEQVAGADLDAAVARRRGEVEAELAALPESRSATGTSGQGDG